MLQSNILWLRCPEIARAAKPGQFVMVCASPAKCTLPRPFSVHQINGDYIALFFAVWEDGIGTNWLSQRARGETVHLFGPLGNGFTIEPAAKSLLLMAGGLGIAPLYFLADYAQNKGYKVRLLYGTANANRYPEKDMPRGVEVISATEDGAVGKKGLVTDLLSDLADGADQIFACGQMTMYRDMALKKNELKIDRKPVQVSLEVRMGCGLGVCYGCTVKTKAGPRQACKDGPVFDLNDVLWEELVL
jgi:dihydroorotate dehydrogenase electron transfer subunit